MIETSPPAANSAPPSASAVTLPIDAHYESPRKSYLVQDADTNWMAVDREAIKHRLAQLGIRLVRKGAELIAPADVEVLRIQHERNVTYAGALAGHKRGIHWINGIKVLVTHSPVLVEPKQGDWSMLRTLIDQQLAAESPTDIEQTPYWHAWTLLAETQLRECLELGRVTYGQAMILAGPRNCGKSLLQMLLTVILGGRSASPFAFMVQATPFNKELFGAEHQKIEDEQPHKDIKNRVRFGDAVKQMTATITHPCYGKNRDGLTLTPFWRPSISVNDEPDHLEVLPPMEDSLMDKIILLHCRKKPMPMPAGTGEEKAAFWARLTSELPAYMWWLHNEFKIPAAISDPDRYGVKAFLHPHVMTLLNDLQPEIRLLALIDQIFFMDGAGAWEGTAEELLRQLHDNEAYGKQAKHLCAGSIYCGRLLSKLARIYPDRLSDRRSAYSRDWTIKSPRGDAGVANVARLPEVVSTLPVAVTA